MFVFLLLLVLLILPTERVLMLNISKQKLRKNNSDKSIANFKHIINKVILYLYTFYQPYCMHSTNYYHLIKAIRNHQRTTPSHSYSHSHATHHYTRTALTQNIIANIIDQDHSLQMNYKDQMAANQIDHQPIRSQHKDRLWLLFKASSQELKLSSDSFALQKKMAKFKDERLIDNILEQNDQLRRQNENKAIKLRQYLQQQYQEFSKKRQLQKQIKLQIESCQRQLLALKQAFDAEEKEINERSQKFKEEKTKDFMIKYIAKQDLEMRKIMLSKIKMNQEMDLGQQMMRKRAFNQAKQAINQKKKQIMDRMTKLRQVMDKQTKQQQKLVSQRQLYQKQNKILSKQVQFLLRKLMKEFRDHSRGIQWLIKMLQDMKLTINREDLPLHLNTEDRIFIQQLFSKNHTQPNLFKKNLSTSNNKIKLSAKKPTHLHNIISRTENNTPKTDTTNYKPKFFTHLKTQPNKTFYVPASPIFDDPLKHHITKSNHQIHFDVESQEAMSKSRNKSRISSGIINAKSYKKIYHNTSLALSNLIKNGDWNTQQAIVDVIEEGLQQQINHQRKLIQQKIIDRFGKVHHRQKRNKLKRLLLGQINL